MRRRGCFSAAIIGIIISVCFLGACGAERQQTIKSDAEIASSENVDGESDTPIYTGEGVTCEWMEMSVTLPEDWEDRYIMLESGQGFGIYQKASYEKQEGMGFLFGFQRSVTWLNYGTGEQMVAYTDDGMMYYLVMPTDVPCDMEDEEIVAEYMRMTEQIAQIKTTFHVDFDNVHYDAEQYVIPVSSAVLLEEESLSMFSDNQLWIARNEIFARHGKSFQNEYLQNWFNTCSWYEANEGDAVVDESVLNEIELKNLEKIIAAEEALDTQYPYPARYALSDTVREDIDGDGNMNTISYAVTPQGDAFRCILTIDGEEYDLAERMYICMVSPATDAFYITNLIDLSDGTSGDEDGLEIAVLDYGASDDPVTHFLKYNGSLYCVGTVDGFPFAEENGGVNGFNNNSGVTGQVRMDLIETAYLDGYWWYDSQNQELSYRETGWHNYKYYRPHTLYIDMPVYLSADENAPTMTVPAQSEVYFISSDMEEWIFLRTEDGMEGYIQVKDGSILNVGLPAEDVLSDLYFFG